MSSSAIAASGTVYTPKGAKEYPVPRAITKEVIMLTQYHFCTLSCRFLGSLAKAAAMCSLQHNEFRSMNG